MNTYIKQKNMSIKDSFIKRIEEANNLFDLHTLNARIDHYYELGLISDTDLLNLDALIMEKIAIIAN